MRMRGWILLLSAAALLGSSGCWLSKEMVDGKKKEAPVVQTTPMEVGETRDFKFPPDGEWHNSGIQVLYRDSLFVKPVGLTDGLGEGAVLCRVGLTGEPLYVDGEQSLRFEHFGPLEFKVVAVKAKGFDGQAEVTISKRDGRRR